MNERVEQLSWRQWLTVQLARCLFGLLLRLNRYEVLGADNLQKGLAGDRPVFVGIWHGRLIYSAWYLRHYHPTTLVSQSPDGEMITRILCAWGFDAIRGSSREGGRSALRTMMGTLDDPETLLVVTMDGPIGPARTAKPGSIALAARKRAVFIPMTGTATRQWTFHKSWDDFQLPKPFGKIIIRFGHPLELDPNLADDEMAQMLGAAVTRLEKETDDLATAMD